MATGRPTSSTLPESGTTSFVHNADGMLLRKADAKNQKAEFSYDIEKPRSPGEGGGRGR